LSINRSRLVNRKEAQQEHPEDRGHLEEAALDEEEDSGAEIAPTTSAKRPSPQLATLGEILNKNEGEL
jgi:hypothetical protein